MTKRHTDSTLGNSSRRRFVQGLAAGGVLLGSGLAGRAAWAFAGASRAGDLRGTDFDLEIAELPVDFTGRPRIATAINGQVPGPTLRWREGDTVTLRVTNRLRQSTSLHWHGIVLPNGMDGVPGLTYDGIAPGETFVYRFQVRQSGTFWYHSHSGFQEQTGLYAPLVIDPRDGDPFAADRDYVVMLSDWTDESPDAVYANLKRLDGYYNYNKPTLVDLVRDAERRGLSAALRERGMWDQMRMSPRDLADVSGATYTYLMNGTTPAGNWTGLFRRGEKVRLRFINGAAMSYFDVRIPGLKMTVVAADGQNVHPVTVDEFRIGVAETYDVIVQPEEDLPYTIFAQSMDRSGYARGTLAPRPGLAGEIPALDPVPTLTMADMGMRMDGMDMAGMHGGAMAAMPADPHQGMAHAASPAGDMGGMAADHAMAGHTMPAPSSMQGMGGQGAAPAGPAMPDPHVHHAGMSATDMAGMATAPGVGTGMADQTMAASGGMAGMDGGGTMNVSHHPATENGPGTAMQASVVSTRLDDPGAGLRNNGRRVLTYADLHTLGGWLDPRDPDRTVELHLTGNMERYMWSFDGVRYSHAEPLRFNYGERLRVVLVNDTMMDHPIHLHGMWSELESPDGGFQARKHTVSVKPGHAVAYRVQADARGRWAYHCHLFYHMAAGMFREVRIA